MRIPYAITLAVVIGLGLTIIATYGLPAPTRKAYIVIEVDEITNADDYAALKKMAVKASVEAQFEDGRYLASTDILTALDGTAPKEIIIIAFDNEAKAKVFYDNSKEITAMRTKATKSRAFIVDVCSEGGKLYPDCSEQKSIQR
jgi:uncharacterized protein (DUF1330 family)